MELLKVLSLFALLVCARADDVDQDSTTPEPLKVVNEEVSPEYWLRQAKERFAKDCKMFSSLRNSSHAKNVIMLLGDGMGMPTISASRFYIAEMQGRNGSAVFHPFEEWDFNTMARTYDLETSVTDSASSANAYLTGSKTRTGMIGIDGNLNVKQCGKWDSQHFTQSVLEAANEAGKATGVITNTRITHASPSGTYAHVTYRDMESDAKIKEFCPTEHEEMHCQDIACQLIQNHQYINVIIGGGQKNFYPNDVNLKADDNKLGVRLDGRNLIEEWINNKTKENKKFCFVGKPEELKDCKPSENDYILALPYEDHMPYTHDIPRDKPDLLDYVRTGLEVLKRQKNGFFLFIESGRIDHAHHNNYGRYSLDEMLEFDKIINYIQASVDLKETLLIVTADHSHALELVGQPGRFQSVLGIDQYYSNHTKDKMPLQGLNYMNGPNGLNQDFRKNPSYEDIFAWGYQQQTLVPLRFSSHGGDDVGVYAIGPQSPFFHANVDNTFIAQTMKLALGVKPFKKKNSPCASETHHISLPTIHHLEAGDTSILLGGPSSEGNRQGEQLFPDFYSKAKKAKNVILFLGDGMGIPTLAATRFDRTNTTGKAEKHPFEDWEFSSLCRTYDLETMVTDSASSATAYLTGTKTRTAMIGVTGEVFYKECKMYSDEEKTESVLTAAQKAGKWTGIVTSSRITHASPAGCYGHVAHRDWEVDSKLPCNRNADCACTDLAYQLIYEHQDIHVLMGGAQEFFYPDTEPLPCNRSARGRRWDGRNLPKEWEKTQHSKGRKYVYADSPSAFKKINFEDYDYALSLISASHLPYELDRPQGDPGLYEQAMAAIKILKKSPNGFFLFLEGARIDQAHHENRAMKSFAEQHVFDRVIEDIFKEVNPEETLLVVTADHSHSFALVGQPSRFRSLFLPDLVKGNETLDNKGMQPVGYMTGPGSKMNATRDNVWDMKDETLFGKDTQLQALIPIGWATHGGDDVAVF
ncbi:unnamed protein product, partial [Rodentolepis nana]|uniref:Alkaline phosphatase n=1 Tax=Rodentolepis nana TaxID=102285 RepID=A0A0R3TZQ4_RODNA